MNEKAPFSQGFQGDNGVGALIYPNNVNGDNPTATLKFETFRIAVLLDFYNLYGFTALLCMRGNRYGYYYLSEVWKHL